jgi:NTE family protein
MQDRINRINLAVAPADVLIRPQLGGLKMFDFDQVEHTIEEGYLKVKEKIENIRWLLTSS